MSDNSSLILWILKNHQKSCPHPDRFHLEDELTDKQLNNIFKGLGLPLLYDKVLAFWDNSAFSNCKAGVLFVEDGCYFSRTNKPTYYSEYSELCYSTVLDTALRLVVEPNEIVTITGISSPDGYFLQSLLTALKDGSPKPISSAVKRSGPVKEILSTDLQEVRRNTEDIKKTQLLEVVNRGSDLIHQAEELFQYLSDQECDMQRFNAVLRAYQSYFEFVQSLMNESILDYESGYQLIMNLLRSYTEILKNYIVEYAYTHNGKLPNICDSYIQTILSFAEPQFTEPLFDYIYLNNNLSKMDAKNSLLSHLLLVGNARIRIEDTRYLVSQIPEKEGYLKLQNSIEEYNTKRLQSALSAQ